MTARLDVSFGSDALGLIQLKSQDALWLAVVHAHAFEAAWSVESFASLLDQPSTLGLGLAGSQDALLLVSCLPPEAEVLTIAVAPEARGQGRGARLLEGGLAVLRALDVHKVYLEVAKSRKAAQKLYEKTDFKLQGVRPNYYKTTEGREDALLMVRDLV